VSSASLDALALARALGVAWSVVARGSARGESLLLPGGSAGLAGEQLVPTNWVVVHGPDGVADAVRVFAGRLRDRGLPGLIGVSPAVAAPAEPVAVELGLTPGDPLPLMACPAGAFRSAERPGDGLDVVQVRDEAGLDEVAGVLADAFAAPFDACRGYLGPPGRHATGIGFFLSRIDGVGAAAVTTAQVGDVVGIFAMGTRADLRRRGAGAAALTAAMRHHLDRGAVVFVLQASDMGRPLYEALGFATLEEAATWLVLPARQTG